MGTGRLTPVICVYFSLDGTHALGCSTTAYLPKEKPTLGADLLAAATFVNDMYAGDSMLAKLIGVRWPILSPDWDDTLAKLVGKKSEPISDSDAQQETAMPGGGGVVERKHGGMRLICTQTERADRWEREYVVLSRKW